MATAYTPRVRTYYNTPYTDSPDHMPSPRQDIHLKYAAALDEIEELRSERRALKADLNRALDENANLSYKDQSMSMDLASNNLKFSHTKRALFEAEERSMELEEENIKLRHLLESKIMRLHHLQDEIVNYKDKVDQLGHIEEYSRHLQTEMESLDVEFQTITKRVNELDDEKTKDQATKAVSGKYRQDYNQTLLKYIDGILKSVESLDPKSSVRARYEELFPKGSSMQKFVLSRDYTNLTLKSLKFIADIMTAFVPENDSPTGFTPFSTIDVSPARVRTNSACSVNTKSKRTEASPISSALTQSPRYGQTPLSTKKNSAFQTPVAGSRVQSRGSVVQQPLPSADKAKNSRVEKLSATTSKKEQKSLYLPSRCSAATFGASGKSRSNRSSVAVSSSGSSEQAQSKKNMSALNASKKQDINQIEKFSSAVLSRKESEYEVETGSYAKDEYQNKTAAELELLQRDRDLIEKERELMEKKRELLARARELEEKEATIKQLSIPRESDRKTSGLSSASQKSGVPPPRTTPLAKDSDRDNLDRRNPEEGLSHSSSTLKLRTAKEASEALREKSKHLARVLTRVSSHDVDPKSQYQRGDDDLSGPRDPANCKSRERTPVSSYKNLDQTESFHLYSAKGSNRNLVDNSNNQYKDEDNNSAYGSEYSYKQDRSRVNYSEKSASKPPRPFSDYNSHVQTPETTGRNDISANRGDYQKKVSFDANQDYQEDSIKQKYGSFGQVESRNPEEDNYRNDPYGYQGYNGEGQEEDEVEHGDDEHQEELNYHPSRTAEEYGPRGTQFSTFSVSFGRTESHQRSLSPPRRDLASILDVPLKGRVDHLMQSYDVVRGEERRTKAVKERLEAHYKYVPEPVSGRSLKKSVSTESKKFVKMSSGASDRDIEESSLASPPKQ